MAEDNDTGRLQIDLGKRKKVTVRQFKGRTLVDIREFYASKKDEGKELPGAKGISLTVDVWRELVKAIPNIDGAIGDLERDEVEDKPRVKERKAKEREVSVPEAESPKEKTKLAAVKGEESEEPPTKKAKRKALSQEMIDPRDDESD